MTAARRGIPLDRDISSRILPWSVNFVELLNRLIKICLSLSGSVLILSGIGYW